jgi:ATP-dependent DNA helicase RecQ
MVQRRPASPAELGRLSGVGEKKLERYGNAFLRLILKHRGTASAPRQPISDTAMESANLFRLGMSYEQIAQRRGLKTSTILDHLALVIQNGQLSGREVVGLSADEISLIERVWHGLPEDEQRGVKPLYDAFEGKHEYGILRCLRAEWDRTGTLT